MSTNHFGLVPPHLTGEQRAQWLRRMQTAQQTLETQALAGTVANAETINAFQRYVRGETTLGDAIGQARAQLAQEHAAFREMLNRRNIL